MFRKWHNSVLFREFILEWLSDCRLVQPIVWLVAWCSASMTSTIHYNHSFSYGLKTLHSQHVPQNTRYTSKNRNRVSHSSFWSISILSINIIFYRVQPERYPFRQFESGGLGPSGFYPARSLLAPKQSTLSAWNCCWTFRMCVQITARNAVSGLGRSLWSAAWEISLNWTETRAGAVQRKFEVEKSAGAMLPP